MTHQQLWQVCIKLPTDFEPYGQRSREDGEQDCSCGCRFFVPLVKPFQYDWGVCAHPESPRRGLLTFEHQGCPQFTPEDEIGEGKS